MEREIGREVEKEANKDIDRKMKTEIR